MPGHRTAPPIELSLFFNQEEPKPNVAEPDNAIFRALQGVSRARESVGLDLQHNFDRLTGFLANPTESASRLGQKVGKAISADPVGSTKRVLEFTDVGDAAFAVGGLIRGDPLDFGSGVVGLAMGGAASGRSIRTVLRSAGDNIKSFFNRANVVAEEIVKASPSGRLVDRLMPGETLTARAERLDAEDVQRLHREIQFDKDIRASTGKSASEITTDDIAEFLGQVPSEQRLLAPGSPAGLLGEGGPRRLSLQQSTINHPRNERTLGDVVDAPEFRFQELDSPIFLVMDGPNRRVGEMTFTEGRVFGETNLARSATDKNIFGKMFGEGPVQGNRETRFNFSQGYARPDVTPEEGVNIMTDILNLNPNRRALDQVSLHVGIGDSPSFSRSFTFKSVEDAKSAFPMFDAKDMGDFVSLTAPVGRLLRQADNPAKITKFRTRQTARRAREANLTPDQAKDIAERRVFAGINRRTQQIAFGGAERRGGVGRRAGEESFDVRILEARAAATPQTPRVRDLTPEELIAKGELRNRRLAERTGSIAGSRSPMERMGLATTEKHYIKPLRDAIRRGDTEEARFIAKELVRSESVPAVGDRLVFDKFLKNLTPDGRPLAARFRIGDTGETIFTQLSNTGEVKITIPTYLIGTPADVTGKFGAPEIMEFGRTIIKQYENAGETVTFLTGLRHGTGRSARIPRDFFFRGQ